MLLSKKIKQLLLCLLLLFLHFNKPFTNLQYLYNTEVLAWDGLWWDSSSVAWFFYQPTSLYELSLKFLSGKKVLLARFMWTFLVLSLQIQIPSYHTVCFSVPSWKIHAWVLGLFFFSLLSMFFISLLHKSLIMCQGQAFYS